MTEMNYLSTKKCGNLSYLGQEDFRVVWSRNQERICAEFYAGAIWLRDTIVSNRKHSRVEGEPLCWRFSIGPPPRSSPWACLLSFATYSELRGAGYWGLHHPCPWLPVGFREKENTQGDSRVERGWVISPFYVLGSGCIRPSLQFPLGNCPSNFQVLMGSSSTVSSLSPFSPSNGYGLPLVAVLWVLHQPWSVPSIWPTPLSGILCLELFVWFVKCILTDSDVLIASSSQFPSRRNLKWNGSVAFG